METIRKRLIFLVGKASTPIERARESSRMAGTATGRARVSGDKQHWKEAASAHENAAKQHEKLALNPRMDATVAAHLQNAAEARLAAGASAGKATALQTSRDAWRSTVQAHQARPTSGALAPQRAHDVEASNRTAAEAHRTAASAVGQEAKTAEKHREAAAEHDKTADRARDEHGRFAGG